MLRIVFSLFHWLVSHYWLSAGQTRHEAVPIGAVHYIKDGVARILTAFSFIYAQHF